MRQSSQNDLVQTLRAEDINFAVQMALAEDLGPGDVTTLATVPADGTASAHVVAREPLVMAGLPLAEATFRALSPQVTFEKIVEDGARVEKGAGLLKVSGPAQALLSAERVALNFVQRLSGIATLTAQFVEAVKDTKVKILDTRKTTPGLRRLEKYAVRCGGGQNHRFGLYDMVLIKDNHLVALRQEGAAAVVTAVRRARAAYPTLKIEVEADTLDQVEQALAAGADIILLDNMSLQDMRRAAEQCRGKALTEASGGIRLHTIQAIAQTGVDFISVGALTHSARAVDIGLDFEL